MTDADAAELDELRAKAYGPDGELTDAQARRLDELQERARGAAPTVDASTDPGAVDAAAAVLQPSAPETSETSAEGERLRAESNLAESDGDAAAEQDVLAHAAGVRGIVARRWFPYAAVGIALLLGFGVGFAVFGQEVLRSVALSLSVGAERAELEARGEYDPGSITPLEQVREATIWHVTRDDGDTQCVLVTVEDRRERACTSTDQFDNHGAGLYAGISLPADVESESSGLNVNVVRALDGDLDVAVQLWTPGMWEWRSQYTEDELATLDRIERETGISGESVELIGYDGDRPIWVEYLSTGTCIIAALDVTVERACADHPNDPETATLEVDVGDGWVTTYRLSAHDVRPLTLTIERIPAMGPDGAGDETTGDIEP
ncbi:hypothetical protein M2317_002864 [Microbacterium sp. ZKA21]|uniref:hypothetical protein n=1 Tax=Microbacterium sp. ZKA21 TaxID=3381694 RepID=UPI003D25151A